MLSRRSADRAFARFQRTGSPRALARVFARTAGELLRLARHLANGEAAAEDLVQATFVTAIEAAQTHQPGSPVLPWLVGILGNHAHATRRRARRAVDPGRLRPDGAVDPLTEVEARELSVAVRDAIGGLPELYRSVLRLYLEHGFEPSEIARTLERPAGTVRAQVSRGLDLLRAALPAALGASVACAAVPARGLAAVRQAVLAHCPGAVGGATALSLSMGTAIMTHGKLITAAAALAAASLFGWHLARGERSSDPGAIAPPAAALQAAPEPVVPATSEKGARTVIAANAATPAAAATAKRTGVRVHVRRADAPAAAVGVRLHDGEGLGLASATEPVPTDADGTAVLEVTQPGSYWVSIERADLRRLVQVSAGELTEVALTIPRGITVEGTVRDPAGQPVAGATILAHAISLFPDAVATCDAQGRYRVPDLAAGVRLQACAAGASPAAAYAVDGRAGTTITLDLPVGGRARRIVGQVWHADGRVAAGVRVACAPTVVTAARPGAPFHAASFTRADADGRFTFAEAPTAPVSVVALPEQAGDEVAQGTPVQAGADDAAVDLHLGRGATLHGRIEGEHRGGVTIQAWAARPDTPLGYLTNILGLRRAQTAADGTFVVRGLLAGHHEVSAQRVQILARDEIDVTAGADVEWNPRLDQGARLQVAIQPVGPPGAVFWFVRLYRRGGDGNLEFANFTVSGPDGNASFQAPDPAASYDVVVGHSRGAKDDVIVAVLRDVRPRTEPYRIEIAPTQMPTAHLRGRVVSAAGEVRANRALSARAQADDVLVSRASALTDGDGCFDVGPLPPGRWTLFLDDGEATRRVGEFTLLSDTDVDAGDVLDR